MNTTLEHISNTPKAQNVSAPLSVSFGGHSTAGIKTRNDDAFAAHMPNSKYTRQLKGAVACIADGVSVSDRSHIASQLAVTQFIDDYFATPESWNVETCASKVLRALNDWLSAQSRHNQTSAMVTTFSAVVLKSKSLHIFHVGDSRIYRLRRGEIKQLTRDHAMNFSKDNTVLTSALGMDTRLMVDYSQHDAQVGDVILLTTDGLTSFLPPAVLTDTLSSTLTQYDTLEAATKAICDIALTAGSDDNITCGLMRVYSLPHENIDEAHARVQRQKIPPVMKSGNIIDDYKIISVLKSGTRSHLYRVECQKTQKDYILKAPSKNFENDPVYLEGFIREQWVGRRLDHPGLMKVLPGRENSDFLYLICELIRGYDLRDWMGENPNPPLSKVREIIGDIIQALRAMHRMGMVHRDIKPENIMMTHEGDIKIIDYGTVQVAGIDEISSPIVEDHAVGSVNYSAPEFVLGAKATTQSDIYSLGVIAYEMLAGQRPYRDKAAATKRPTGLDDWNYVSLKTKRTDLPNWACYAIEKACEKNPDNRYQVMSAFIEDLTKPADWTRQKESSSALLETNPVAFWKGLSLTLMGVIIILAALLVHNLSS